MSEAGTFVSAGSKTYLSVPVLWCDNQSVQALPKNLYITQELSTLSLIYTLLEINFQMVQLI